MEMFLSNWNGTLPVVCRKQFWWISLEQSIMWTLIARKSAIMSQCPPTRIYYRADLINLFLFLISFRIRTKLMYWLYSLFTLTTHQTWLYVSWTWLHIWGRHGYASTSLQVLVSRENQYGTVRFEASTSLIFLQTLTLAEDQRSDIDQQKNEQDLSTQ